MISPIRHDTANFGSSFVAGRGNLTSVTRHDVTSQTAAVTTKTRYDIAGSVVARLDPLNRKVRFEYSDVFNDTTTPRNTFAYPTKVYDPANNFSEAKYRFDIGANVWARSPAPAGQTVGKTTARLFDNIGRLEKETVVNSGAYTRYAYPTNGVQSQVYTTIVDTNNNNTGDAADEVLSETWTDGAGRVRLSRVPHTFSGGSTATWAGAITEYDILGRVKRQSVPTEVDANFDPAGDDQTRGWLWTHQRYDWMGRVVRRIATDGDPNAPENDSDVLISYAGCGCAGGVITTVQSEVVPRDDDPSLTARRVKKSYSDILGRTWKTESFQWDGTSVFSTLVNSFDSRDQVIRGRQYAGTISSETFQDTTVEYDGFGRTIKTHKPGQETNEFISYNYNLDGSISSVVDGRGAITNNTYDASGLLVQRTSTMPGLNPDPDLGTSVSFEYDDLGNPTRMTDEHGLTDYEYNELGQLTAEVRQFSDSMPNAPISGNRFRISYSYTLSGQLRSYSDPFGQEINYTFDKAGKPTDVIGSSFGGVTDYSRNAEYRAWGSLKAVSAGSGMQLGLSYNNRLRTSSYSLADASQNLIMDKSYSYQKDGKLSYLQDHLNARFDRLNTYDHAGRIRSGKSGAEARGGTVASEDMKFDLPYRQSYEFNEFNNLTGSTNLHWGETSWVGQSFATNYTYLNNRVQQGGWTYDEDGRNTASSNGTNSVTSTFNAAGKRARTLSTYSDVKSYYDGNGAEIKRESSNWDDEETEWIVQPTKYFIRSSVFGGNIISEVWASGKKHRSYVKGIGNQTAVQSAYANETAQLNELVLFEFADPSGMSYRTTNKLGQAAAYGDGGEGSPIETDPLGGNVGVYTPFISLIIPYDPEFPEMQPYHPGSAPGQSFSSLYATFGSRIADLPGFGTMWGSFGDLDMVQYEERVANARGGFGFITHERRLELEAVVARLGNQLRARGLQVHQAGFTLHVQGRLNLEGGDFTSDEIVSGNWIDTSTADTDLENNIVTVFADGYFDFGEADFGGDEWRKVPLPSNFRDLLRERISATQPGQTISCNDFIAKIIAKVVDTLNSEGAERVREANSRGQGNPPWVDYTPDGVSGLDLLNKVSRFTLVENLNINGHGAGGTVKGSIKGGDAEVLILQQGYWYPTYRGFDPIRMWTNYYIGTAIHELTHLAGRGPFSDGRLALAAFDLGLSKTAVTNPDSNDINEIFKNSGTWGDTLRKFCGAR